MRKRRGYLGFLFCISLSPGFAQQDAAPAPNPPITLHVVAAEKSGTHVAGLQLADSTLLDNKVPSRILSFGVIGDPAASEGPPTEIILLIDEVNTNFTHVAYTREQVQKFLRQNPVLPAPVSLAVFTDKGTALENTPSRDANVLLADLNDNKNGLRTINRSQGFYGAGDRLDLSLKTLSQLAAREAPKPGRKLVIWIGPGWPLLSGPAVQLDANIQTQFFNDIVRLSTELRQANITLYSVDPLGTDDGIRTVYYEEFLKGVAKPSEVYIGNLAQQVLARQSGGVALHSNNDVAGEITQCFADINTYYVLTFEPVPGDKPNEYHALEVKVDKPGVTARTRSGYYAQPKVVSRR